MSHIFLDNIFEYDLNNIETSDINYKYSRVHGYWINNNSQPCILDPDFAKPRTKKEDRETGEDQKGE